MNPGQKLMQIVQDKGEKLIDLTQALVRIPSVNELPNGNEGPCQEYLLGRLQDLHKRGEGTAAGGKWD